MLTAREIARAQADLEELLPDTCTIQRRQLTSDGGGGQDVVWVDLAVDVPCRIAPVGGGERSQASGQSTVSDRIAAETTHVLTVPHGQDTEEPDRVTLSGQTYIVTAVRKRGSWELARRVEIKEQS